MSQITGAVGVYKGETTWETHAYVER